MNSEKLHANNGVPEIGNLTNEQLEQLRNNITKELGRRTIEAMKLLIDKIESQSDDEYEALVDRANTGDAEAQKELTDYQNAKAEIAKSEALEKAAEEVAPEEVVEEVAPEEVVAEEPAAEAEVSEAEDNHEVEDSINNLSGILTEQEMNNVLEGRDYNDNGEAAEEAEKVEGESFSDEIPFGKIEEPEAEGDAEPEGEAEIPEGMQEVIEQKANEIIEELRSGEIQKAKDELEEDFEDKVEQADKKRQGRMLKFFKKHPKLAKVALIAIVAIAGGSGILASFAGNFKTNNNSEAKIESSNNGVYNEWAAHGYGNEASDADVKLENEAGAEKEETAEKVSSTATFTIDGKEFTYENKAVEGGYDKGLDGFYDDDKDGSHSMMGPAYEGEWKGEETAFESYEGLMAGLKGSPEIASQIAMVAGIPGAENIHSLSALNDYADELRNKDEKAFDEFMTTASDYINNFVNGGEMTVLTIEAGREYQSSFSYEYDGDLEIGVDKSVTHNFDVQVIDFVDENGVSMFNSDEAKAQIREMFGISSKRDFTAGWSARCGQIVVMMEAARAEARVDSMEAMMVDYMNDSSRPNRDRSKNTPETTPEETDTPEETETPEDSSTPEETGTPEDSETPEETLAPKGENTNAGDNQQQMGTTENNQNDVEVEASADNRVDGQTEPGAAVPGDNTEGVNTEDVNPAGLNQTETQPTEDKSNEASRTENVEHGGDAQSLADRMAAAEAAERNS